MVKKNRPKKVDIRKKRKKLIKLREKKIEDESREKKGKEKKIDIRIARETKMYWARAVTGATGGFIARGIFQLIGWWIFLWLIAFWFLFPFFVSFVIFKFEYDKEEWNWKKIITPGLSIYFFLFMLVSVFTNTLIWLYF